MKIQEAIKILEQHNRWRRNQDPFEEPNLQSPKKIGEAIDCLIQEAKKNIKK